MADADAPVADDNAAAAAPEPESDPPTAIARGVAVAIVLAAAGVVAWLAVAPDTEEAGRVTTGSSVAAPATTTTAPPPVTSTTTTSSSVAAPVTAPPTTDLRSLPAGLGCAALTEMGLTYSQVVQYWNGTAQPVELDADADGEPCEQAFPRSVIEAELGAPEPVDASSTTVPGATGLPPGLRCADLGARGVGVDDAIAYYLAQGSPRRMDADGNGIPCETVYADAAAAWNDRR